MFAKKNNIGDNFSGFGEYINKYMDFAYALEDRGIKLMPAERLRARNGIDTIRKYERFFEEVLEEKDD